MKLELFNIKYVLNLFSAMFIFALLANTAFCEDIITRNSGQVIKGKITRFDNDGVMILYNDQASGRNVSLKFFYRDMRSLQLDIPASYQTGMKQFSEGKYKEAISSLEPIVTKFKGAIDPRVGTALITVADSYVALNELTKAEPLYNEFAKLYPDQVSRSNVGLAKLALSKGDAQKVLTLLGSFDKEASEVQSPSRSQERAFCEAYYLLGQAYEKNKDYTKALEAYLKSAVIYNGYQEIAALAQAKADELRKVHNPEKQTPVVFVP